MVLEPYHYPRHMCHDLSLSCPPPLAALAPRPLDEIDVQGVDDRACEGGGQGQRGESPVTRGRSGLPAQAVMEPS